MKILDAFDVITADQGSVLIEPESEPPAIGLVIEGLVKSTLVSKSGLVERFRRTISVAGPGSWFGVECLGGKPHLLRHEAVMESRVQVIPVMWIMNEAPREIVNKLLSHVVNRWGFKASQQADRQGESVDRILYVLSMIRNVTTQPEVPLTQNDLADLAGLNRSTANQAIREVAEMGLIDLGRGWFTLAAVEEIRDAFRRRRDTLS